VRQQAPSAPDIAQPDTGWDVRRLDWSQFEKLVALLFDAEGFVVECYGNANPDDGITLVAKKGEVTFGVQCKHWKSARVGIKEARAFVLALHDRRLQHGFLVTLDGYTHAALAYARRNQIELMDEPMLRRNLEEVQWRLNPAFAELMNDNRKICPKCESEMVLRTATKGAHAGQQYWGCSTYPRCTFRMPV
jgi:restriction system protein